MDVITIIAVAALISVPSWLTIRTHKTLDKVDQKVGVVKDQVVNGHTSPMRQDMDEMRSALSNLRDEVRGGFSSVRADLDEERSARRDADMEIMEHVKDMRRDRQQP